MTLPRYAPLRGGIYQFSRRVPQDISGITGKKFWRVSLSTDSLSEAVVSNHREIIRLMSRSKLPEMVRSERSTTTLCLNGQRTALDGLMETHRSLCLRQSSVLGIPEALAYNGPPIGDEVPDPIIKRGVQLTEQVKHFVERIGYKIDLPSSDLEKLRDGCEDEYRYGNP